ncbi:hypothetical protein BJ741DRAFT_537486 [Chytriomyces cf. hyalinus JEL632]|nr:hypothetical protein BJ741DRAFT_537486 [Chytriomyces cf. hyalinus JEL632]
MTVNSIHNCTKQVLKDPSNWTIYKDPRNEHHYEVQECKINTTLSKVGVPYFGSNQAIDIDVPDKWMKMVNPVRANINQSMKERINELEETVKQLQLELNESKDPDFKKLSVIEIKHSLLDKIKQLMNGKEYFETDSELFYVDNTLVYYLRRKSSGDNKKRIQRIKHDLMKGDTNLCKELHDNQPTIQKRLHHHLKKEFDEEKIVEIKRR